MPQIESATLADLPQLADLLADLFAQESDYAPDHAKQLRGLQQIIEQPDAGCILVVREGREILGMVNLLFTISTAEGSPVVLMEDLIIHSKRRGKGLGSQLLEHAIKFAQGLGLSRITLLTEGANSKAIKFYQRHGFKSSTMVPMRLHLPGR